jgi:hypothetical protein
MWMKKSNIDNNVILLWRRMKNNMYDSNIIGVMYNVSNDVLFW